MATRTSTGFCAAILGPQSFAQIFAGGCIEIRSGAQPSSADLAPSGALLARITVDGLEWVADASSGGLHFSSGGRFAAKAGDETWLLKGIAPGTATWFRVLPNALDAEDDNLFTPRIDGTIGALGAIGDVQMYLLTTTIDPTTEIAIDQWWYAMPPI